MTFYNSVGLSTRREILPAKDPEKVLQFEIKWDKISKEGRQAKCFKDVWQQIFKRHRLDMVCWEQSTAGWPAWCEELGVRASGSFLSVRQLHKQFLKL